MNIQELIERVQRRSGVLIALGVIETIALVVCSIFLMRIEFELGIVVLIAGLISMCLYFILPLCVRDLANIAELSNKGKKNKVKKHATPEAEEYYEYTYAERCETSNREESKSVDKKFLAKELANFLELEATKEFNDTVFATVDEVYNATSLPNAPKLVGDADEIAKNVCWAYQDVYGKPSKQFKVVVAIIVNKYLNK